MTKTIIRVLSLAIAANLSLFAASAREVTLTTSIADDATFEVLRQIQALPEGKNSITFERGVYHFYPERAYEKYCFISNHNDVMARIAFYINEAQDLTIDGGGSTFIFHGRMIPFLVENSQNVVVKDLSIDFSEPFHSEGVVIAHDTEKRTFDMSISDQYPYELRNGQLYFLKPYYSHTVGQNMVFDPELGGTAFQTEKYSLSTSQRGTVGSWKDKITHRYKTDSNDDYIKWFGAEPLIRAEQIERGVVRVYNQKRSLPPIGMIVTMKGEQGQNRFAPGFKLNNVKGFNCEGVTVFHAGGMGFLFENCEDVDLYKCQIKPAEGRIISTTADATHFVGCRGQISLRECVFRNQLDDAMNVHGAYQEVMDILDSHSVGIRVGHFQQLGFTLAFEGDSVGVVRLSDSFHAYHTMTVKSVEQINGRYQVITFNEELPEAIKEGDLLENLSAYPDVLVENCEISRNRARGLLISTPKSTTIRGNLFSTEMEAILLPVESSKWFESGNATNVLIEGNTFQDCTTGGMDRGVIRLHTDDENTNIAFENIVVRNNTFNHFDNLILQITNVDGFLVEGNTITNSGTFPQQYPDNAVVTIQHSQGVKFRNNRYQGKATKMVEMLDGDKSVKFK